MADVTQVRLVFVGTKDFAVPTFVGLLEHGFNVVGLVTQPERPQGRKQERIPAPIKVEAQKRGIPVFQPESINDEGSLEQLRALDPDLIVTVAYGQILSPAVLGLPRLGAVNLHGSILPAYRGAAPVARAIENGELETGVTVIAMDPRVDAGGILAIARTAIEPNETAGELEERLAHLGAPLLPGVIAQLASGSVSPLPQDPARVSRARKLRKEEGEIDWSQSALQIHNRVRAFQPWPSASTHFQPAGSSQAVRLIILRSRAIAERASRPAGQVERIERDRLLIATGDGLVEPLVVQLPGKKAVPVDAFLRGRNVTPETVFGPPEAAQAGD